MAAILVGAALRGWRLGDQSLWYDEWLTAEAATGSLRDLVRYVTDQAGIPPTYFAFMWGWARVVGDSDAALRAASALAGVATVPLAYAAVRELGRHARAARWAAVLVAVNPMLVWYSQEARPYSLLAFLGALSLWALARVWRRGRRLDLGIWAFVCACAVAVQYFAVFLVIVQVAALVVRPPRWQDESAEPPRRWRYQLPAVVPAAVVLAGLAPFGLRQFSQRGNHSWITDHAVADRLSEAGQSALAGPSVPDGRLWMIVAGVAAIAVLSLVARGDLGDRRAAAIAGGIGLLTVVPALGATVVGVDVIIGRYLIVALVPLIVAVAVALGAARLPAWVGGAVVAVVGVVSLVSVISVARDPLLQRADWRSVAEAHEAGGTQEAGGAGAGERLLVLNRHGYLGEPLVRYLDEGRVLDTEEPITVEEIDVLAAKPGVNPCNGFVGLTCLMIFLGARPPEPLADRLTLTDRIELDQFVIERYRADGPVTVTVADVVPAIDVDHALVLVTPSSP